MDGNDEIGVALRTRRCVKPVYVSIGHRIDLRSAVDVVLATTRRFRLLEPIRLAHQSATALCRRRGIDSDIRPSPLGRDS
jgi:deoxyribonuclease V